MSDAYTNRFSEVHVPLVIQYADDRGPGTHATAYVSLANYHRAVLILNVGDMAAGATVDAGIQQASDNTGTGVKAISGKTITQLTQAGGDASSFVVIELRTEELDVTNGFEHVRFYVTTAVNTVIYSAVLLGIVTRFAPVPTTNYAEIVD